MQQVILNIFVYDNFIINYNKILLLFYIAGQGGYELAETVSRLIFCRNVGNKTINN